MRTLFVYAVLIFFLVLFIFSYLQMTSSKKRRLSDREEIDIDKFYSLFYEGSGLPKDIVIQILKTISAVTEMPINKLRPQDRFDKELRAAKGWEFDDGLSLLSVETSKLFRKRKIQINLIEIKTIDDYIRCIAPHLIEENRQPG